MMMTTTMMKDDNGMVMNKNANWKHVGDDEQFQQAPWKCLRWE